MRLKILTGTYVQYNVNPKTHITFQGVNIGFDTQGKRVNTYFIKLNNEIFPIIGEVSQLDIMAPIFFRMTEYERNNVFPALCKEILFKFETPREYFHKLNRDICKIMSKAMNAGECIVFALALCKILNKSPVFAMEMYNNIMRFQV